MDEEQEAGFSVDSFVNPVRFGAETIVDSYGNAGVVIKIESVSDNSAVAPMILTPQEASEMAHWFMELSQIALMDAVMINAMRMFKVDESVVVDVVNEVQRVRVS